MQNGNKTGHENPNAPSSDGAARPVPAQPDTSDVDSPVRVADSPQASAAAEPASVHVIVMTDRTRIVVSGEIDADLGPDLQEAAADAELTGLPIEVDAQHVTFMDSSGIAFLARLASRSGDRVRVLRAPDPVRFLLEVTKIGELLDLVDDVEPAGPAAPATPAAPIAADAHLPRIGLTTSSGPDDAA